MGRPKLERNGDSEGQEMSEAVVDDIEAATVPSPAPKAATPTKLVVFRSKDKELTLFQKAGFTDKSHGFATYIQSTGIKFDDYYLKLEDTPENAKTIAWVRRHPSCGFSYLEVPDLSNIVELPPIAQLKQMTINELKELCTKNEVKVKAEDSKESIILALVEKG